jgi:hypothetical protein
VVHELADSETELAPTIDPVLLTATRGAPVTIKPRGEAPLTLSDVTIGSGSTIQAENLVVKSRLALTGDSTLGPTAGGNITIGTETAIVLEARDEKLPQLDLGLIGQGYAVVPAEVYVAIPSGGLGGSEHCLISGRTLGNCEDWRPKVTISRPHEFQDTRELRRLETFYVSVRRDSKLFSGGSRLFHYRRNLELFCADHTDKPPIVTPTF